MLIINGLGCVVTGGKVILARICEEAPQKEKILVLSVLEREKKAPKNIYWLRLPHWFFGKLLRVPVECVLGLFTLIGIVRILNLSNYGFCMGGRYIVYLHSPLLVQKQGASGFSGGRSNWIKRLMIRSCLRFSDGYVVQTQHMAEAFRSMYEHPGMKLRVLLPKVEIDPQFLKNEGEARIRWFYPTSKFPHKRADLAMAAMRTKVRTGENDCLLITAEGETRDGVVCVGAISYLEVMKYYARADFLLFTSELETLGLPLLEALQFGLPAVLPDLPYAREIYGEAAVYFREFTPEAVARAMVTLEQNENEYRVRARLRCREENAKRLSWAEQWMVFEEMWKEGEEGQS